MDRNSVEVDGHIMLECKLYRIICRSCCSAFNATTAVASSCFASKWYWCGMRRWVCAERVAAAECQHTCFILLLLCALVCAFLVVKDRQIGRAIRLWMTMIRAIIQINRSPKFNSFSKCTAFQQWKVALTDDVVVWTLYLIGGDYYYKSNVSLDIVRWKSQRLNEICSFLSDFSNGIVRAILILFQFWPTKSNSEHWYQSKSPASFGLHRWRIRSARD